MYVATQIRCQNGSAGLEKMFISREANPNFVENRPNFPPFSLFGRTKFPSKWQNFPPNTKISLQIPKFPGKELPKFPIFSSPLTIAIKLKETVYYYEVINTFLRMN